MENDREMSAAKHSLKDKLMAIILLETAKPFEEMDSDLVTECVDFLMELEGRERLTKEEIEQRVKEIPFKGRITALGSYTKKKMRAKRIAVIAAVLALILALFGIVSIASGNTYGELFRQMGASLYELLSGGSMEHENITLIKSDETKEYSSLDELVRSEEIEILYPTWLPENEKIVKVWHLVKNDEERYIFACNNPNYSFVVEIGSMIAKDIEEECLFKNTNGYDIYYFYDTEYIQANFTYKSNLYIIKSDTEEKLFRIIENLEEIT
ncbi:MAG: hypothetical protein IJE72_01515 [Clostridia bacterium]|nr:hypothetical protein [Clostridia bacterium]